MIRMAVRRMPPEERREKVVLFLQESEWQNAGRVLEAYVGTEGASYLGVEQSVVACRDVGFVSDKIHILRPLDPLEVCRGAGAKGRWWALGWATDEATALVDPGCLHGRAFEPPGTPEQPIPGRVVSLDSCRGRNRSWCRAGKGGSPLRSSGWLVRCPLTDLRTADGSPRARLTRCGSPASYRFAFRPGGLAWAI